MTKGGHTPKNIVLVGMMGCGKSSTAKALSKLLPDFSLIEMDLLIEEKEQMTINEIFSTKGEKYFRNAENALIKDLLGKSNLIISTGGGAFLNDSNKKLFNQNSFTVYLSAKPNTIFERVKNDKSRPLLNTGNDLLQRITSILFTREPHYKQAEVQIFTDNKNVEQIAQEILEKYEHYGK